MLYGLHWGFWLTTFIFLHGPSFYLKNAPAWVFSVFVLNGFSWPGKSCLMRDRFISNSVVFPTICLQLFIAFESDLGGCSAMPDFLCMTPLFAYLPTFSSKGLSACQNPDLSTEMRLFESVFIPLRDSPVGKIRTKQISLHFFKDTFGFFTTSATGMSVLRIIGTWISFWAGYILFSP